MNKEVFNTDAPEFDGCGMVNLDEIVAEEVSQHELDYPISITVPPLGVAFFKRAE